MAAHGLQEGTLSWEHYISDPGETPEQDLVTHIYFQLGD
jgi:effector-binding domain-containing protein